MFPIVSNTSILVFNGEIGIVVGQLSKAGASWKPWKIAVEFSSQQGVAYDFSGKDFSREGSNSLELAYAVTIHKAQGSEFGLTILVLPDPCWLMSCELLYTALTRQVTVWLYFTREKDLI